MPFFVKHCRQYARRAGHVSPRGAAVYVPGAPGAIGAGVAAGMLGTGTIGGLGGGAAAFVAAGAGAGGGGVEPAALCTGAEKAGPAWELALRGVCAAVSVGGQGGQFGSRGAAAAALGLGRFWGDVFAAVVAGACPYNAGSRTAL